MTVFAEISKEAKRTPGPANYKVGPSKDKMCLPRTLGTFKSNLDKVSITTCQSFAKKSIPAPQKYKLNYNQVEPRTPFYAAMSKSLGRDMKQKIDKKRSHWTIKKDKSPGPGTYKLESGLRRLAQYPSTVATSFSGFSVAEGARPNITQKDKLQIKSTRCFDTIVRNSKLKGPPGVGTYKGVENAYTRVSSKPRSLSTKRH